MAILDGGACAICTHSARSVAYHFRGVVLGYRCALNPTAVIGSDGYEGHDFTLIDDRWLVDYWAWRVVEMISQPILDLSIDEDRTLASILYGPMNAWQPVGFTPTL